MRAALAMRLHPEFIALAGEASLGSPGTVPMRLAPPCMLLLFAAAGCPGGDDGTGSSAGSSTGDTSGASTTDAGSGTTMFDPTASASDGPPMCVETPTVLALDEPSPLGFSAAELLAGKLGPRATALVFDDFDGIAVAYRGQTLALDVELRHAGGEVRWIDVVTDSEGGPACVDRIEVDVELDFMTEDGAFAESRAAVLVASTVDAATLEVLLPDLMGSLDPATLYENGWAVTGLLLTGTWSQELAGGKLWSETKDSDFGRFSSRTR